MRLYHEGGVNFIQVNSFVMDRSPVLHKSFENYAKVNTLISFPTHKRPYDLKAGQDTGVAITVVRVQTLNSCKVARTARLILHGARCTVAGTYAKCMQLQAGSSFCKALE